jgi:hypothetical protein
LPPSRYPEARITPRGPTDESKFDNHRDVHIIDVVWRTFSFWKIRSGASHVTTFGHYFSPDAIKENLYAVQDGSPYPLPPAVLLHVYVPYVAPEPVGKVPAGEKLWPTHQWVDFEFRVANHRSLLGGHQTEVGAISVRSDIRVDCAVKAGGFVAGLQIPCYLIDRVGLSFRLVLGLACSVEMGELDEVFR